MPLTLPHLKYFPPSFNYAMHHLRRGSFALFKLRCTLIILGHFAMFNYTTHYCLETKGSLSPEVVSLRLVTPHTTSNLKDLSPRLLTAQHTSSPDVLSPRVNYVTNQAHKKFFLLHLITPHYNVTYTSPMRTRPTRSSFRTFNYTTL